MSIETSLVHSQNFFSNQLENPKNSGQALVDYAKTILDKDLFYWHIDQSGSYAHPQNLSYKIVASDFKLRYWTSGAEIPAKICQLTESRFAQLNSTHFDKDAISSLRMSCYEFCMFLLTENQVLTPHQIDTIFSITAATAKNLNSYDNSQAKDELIPVEYALYNKPISECQIIDENFRPQVGDLIAYVYSNCIKKPPFHYAIYAGNDEVVELLHLDATVSPLFDNECKTLAYCVPLHEISDNVNRFITENQHLLAVSPKLEEEALLGKLFRSQYTDLIDFKDETSEVYHEGYGAFIKMTKRNFFIK